MALACLAFAPALTGGFSYDDAEVIRGNPVVQGDAPILDAFQRDYWHHLEDAGHYRPLASLSLRLDHLLWGPSAPGYHCTTLALHLLVILLAGTLLRRMGVSSKAAALGLIFFACHPALADSVAWISGRTSSICALGGLTGLLLMTGRTAASTNPWGIFLGAALAPFLACLGKEEGVVFVPLAILVGFWWGRGRWACLGAALGLILAAFLRALALGSPIPVAHGAPLEGMPFVSRILEGGLAWMGGLRLVALPLGFSPGEGFVHGENMASAGPYLGGLILCCLALAGFCALGKLKQSPVLAGSCIALLMSIAPTLQILPAPVVFAPRFLYLPLLCAIPLCGALLCRLPNRLLLVGLFAWIPLGWKASIPYTGRAAYWQARLDHGTPDAPAWNAMGNALTEEDRPADARQAYERAIAIDPHYSRPWVNLAACVLSESGPLAARPLLERACAEGPNNPVAHANLGSVLLRLDLPQEAQKHYQRAVVLAPGRGVFWRGLGRALLVQGQRAPARKALTKALLILGSDPSTQALLQRAQED